MKLVLDTNVALYLLSDRIEGGLPPEQYFVSVITELELLSYPQLDAPAEAAIRALLARVGVVELTPEVKEAAVRLRRTQKLKLPDAIVAGTAMALGATLMTNDAAFAKVPKLVCRSILLKPA